MTTAPRLLAGLPVLAQIACFDPTAIAERQIERSFRVSAGSTVHVELAGGSVTAVTGPPGTVHVSIRQSVHTRLDQAQAERLLTDYVVSATADGGDVRVVGRRKTLLNWMRWHSDQVRLSATITAPPGAHLDLDTSGGSITIRGERAGDVRADTSGGGISADGGSGPFVLNTSGGSIRVGRVLGRLSADTSGGGITVRYVGTSAKDVDLATSGGSIRVGVDPASKVSVSAGTTGGTVRVDGLPFEQGAQGRSHANGTINGGGSLLRASTSGGGITIEAAADPGERTTNRE
jgi:hypothetical protein